MIMRKKNLFIAGLAMVVPLLANAANPVCDRVVDYVPAPGQFVNILPEWEEGDDAESMASKAFTYMIPEEAMISLGAYGGYVTVGFDHTIVNADGQDLYIEGNAFQSDASALSGGNSEPGIIMVAYDINGNGMPDDNEWFEIAGSEYVNSVKDYEITYYRPETDDDDIMWNDNKGNSGYVMKNTFNSQPYWPQWLTDEPSLVFKGTRLPDNAVNEGTDDAPYFVLSRFDFGYADNYPNTDSDGTWNEGAKIEIDWAVDKDGNSVKLPGVDFVRIYTGVNQYNGWIGETSTEVCRVMDAHCREVNGSLVLDESLKIDEAVLNEFLELYPDGNLSSIQDVADNDAVRVYIDAAGTLVFSAVKDGVAQVYDQSGRLMHYGRFNAGDCQVDMSTYPAGLYIVNIDGVSTKILKR